MTALTPTHYEQIVNHLNEFITSLKQSAYNISTTHYVTAHHLLNTLAARQHTPTDVNQLSLLLMPLLCSCEKEQLDFPRRFTLWIESLQLDKSPALPTVNDEITEIIKESKLLKKQSLLLVFVLLLALVTLFFQDDIQQRIQIAFDNYFPVEIAETKYSPINKKETVIKAKTNPLAVITDTVAAEVIKPAFNEPSKNYQAYIGFALAILLAIALGYLGFYLRTHRFLKRLGVLSPPQLTHFFLTNPPPLFALLDFTFTAQQLHKHQHILSNYINPEATIRQTLAKRGLFTPCYQMLRAVPEYLILIDRSSFNDQLFNSVNDLIGSFPFGVIDLYIKNNII